MSRTAFRRGNTGFTLIELLIVIAIVGILAALTVASLNESRFKADDAKRTQDMSQMKTALELYAEKNGYTLPVLAVASKEESVKTKTLLSFIATPVYANGHTEVACQRFDQLAQILVAAGYVSQVPKDPKDAPQDTCYKAYSVDTDGDPTTVEAIAVYSILWEKYKIATNGVFGNKKVGFISSGKTDINPSLMAQVCTVTGEFPVFDLSSTSNLCTRNQGDVVADKVLGVGNGSEYASGGTPAVGGHCSDSQYILQEECERDKSYCTNSQYTDQTSCSTNVVSIGGYCSDSQYTDQSSCESNGTYAGGSCSGGSYTTEDSCVNSGYYDPSPRCSVSGYNTESDCLNAMIQTSIGYCSNSSYQDELSCTSATCVIASGYCSDYSSNDQTTCESNSATWNPDQVGSCGYGWTSPTYANAGYSWSPGVFYSNNYTWYSGTYTQNTWTPATSTLNTWYNIPGSTWISE